MAGSLCGCYAHNGFLTRRGYAVVAGEELDLPGVDAAGFCRYVDRSGSVSALVEPPELHWVDQVIDEQNQRFFHGS